MKFIGPNHRPKQLTPRQTTRDGFSIQDAVGWRNFHELALTRIPDRVGGSLAIPREGLDVYLLKPLSIWTPDPREGIPCLCWEVLLLDPERVLDEPMLPRLFSHPSSTWAPDLG